MVLELRKEIEDFAENIYNYTMINGQDLSMAIYFADQYLPDNFTITKDELTFLINYTIINTVYSEQDFVTETFNMNLAHRLKNVSNTGTPSGSKFILFAFLGLGLVLTMTGKKNGL